MESLATLEIRKAVRPWVEKLAPDETILVGVSGGADSIALALGLLLESKVRAYKLVPVVIDHGLQENSEIITQSVISKLNAIGFSEVFTKRAVVNLVDGIEASARRARYEIFDEAIKKYSAKHLFLGHTQNDQAETVLLGLVRGSGTKSISGMAIANGKFIRPLLDLTRELTEKVCDENNIEFWSDPHNLNEEFTRVRVRKNVLPVIEKELGPGISAALARTARIAREDNEALDGLAAAFYATQKPDDLDAQALGELPKAIRSRVLRLAIYAAGAPMGTISAEHLLPIEALVTDWHGQGLAALPGGVKVGRISGRLSLSQQP